MMEYRVAGAKDLDSIIDFANMVFSMVRVPHNFETLLPKVYAAPNLKADIHMIAEEDGRLCGCLGMLDYPLRVAGRPLRIGYLGTMSVHPRVRGRGTMGALVKKQVERAQEMGLDLLALGGQRQRYGTHGFESCGTTYAYSLTAANVRHTMGDVDTAGLAFAPMQAEDVPFALALYDAQAVAGARTQADFLAVVSSYSGVPYVVTIDGERAGYLIAMQDGQRITELVMREEALVYAALKGFMAHKALRALRVETAPHDVALNRLLAAVCEGYTQSNNCMVRVLNPQRVIAAYMALKQTIKPLADGRFAFVCGSAGAVEIAVSCGKIAVQRIDETQDMLRLDERQSSALLFGSNPFAVPEAVQAAVPAGWFPLPFAIPEADGF